MPFTSQSTRWKLSCPRDQGVMDAIKIGEITIDRCESCGGIWLDAGELDRLLALKDAATKVDTGRAFAPSSVHAAIRKCPRDSTPLTALAHHQQKHVTIDRCSSCMGIFLDAGELKDLSEFTLAERMRTLLG